MKHKNHLTTIIDLQGRAYMRDNYLYGNWGRVSANDTQEALYSAIKVAHDAGCYEEHIKRMASLQVSPSSLISHLYDYGKVFEKYSG